MRDDSYRALGLLFWAEVDNMAFPPGHNSNVVIVWRGPGRYPAAVPLGVTVR